MQLEKIPRPLLVFVVLGIGVLFIFLSQKPHSPCDQQVITFKENQAGNLFPLTIKKKTVQAPYKSSREACLRGNSSGSCHEYFQILDNVNRDLSHFQDQCGEQVESIAEAKFALTQGIGLMTQLAWGENPPEPGLEKLGWFLASDVAIYCKLKKQWLRFWGPESWQELVSSIHQKLPGEKQIVDDKGLCTNCETRAKATIVMSEKEIRERSLLFVKCESLGGSL
jgi:hypothetical protein